jgi:hypothetical protein
MGVGLHFPTATGCNCSDRKSIGVERTSESVLTSITEMVGNHCLNDLDYDLINAMSLGRPNFARRGSSVRFVLDVVDGALSLFSTLSINALCRVLSNDLEKCSQTKLFFSDGEGMAETFCRRTDQQDLVEPPIMEKDVTQHLTPSGIKEAHGTRFADLVLLLCKTEF